MVWPLVRTLLLVAGLALLCPGASPTHGQASMVTLTVQVGLVAPGGAAMAPGAGVDAAPASGAGGGPAGGAAAAPASGPAPAPSAPPIDPLAGVEVRAVPPTAAAIASAAPEASVVTDANGTAQLQLTPGRHLIFVPRQDPTGSLGAMVMRALPDGTLAPMWAEVDLSDGNAATITLTGTQLNP